VDKFDKALSSPELPEDWRITLNSIRENYSRRDQLKTLNSMVNKVEYKREEMGRDEWQSPEPFFANGGDCEDFAVAKLLCCEYLGFASRDLEIAIVYDKFARGVHAVLHVKHNNTTLVLDNRSKAIVAVEHLRQYQRPIYYCGRATRRMA